MKSLGGFVVALGSGLMVEGVGSGVGSLGAGLERVALAMVMMIAVYIMLEYHCSLKYNYPDSTESRVWRTSAGSCVSGTRARHVQRGTRTPVVSAQIGWSRNLIRTANANNKRRVNTVTPKQKTGLTIALGPPQAFTFLSATPLARFGARHDMT